MKLLTLARDLRRRKAREKHELFVAEGVRAVEELLRSPIRPRGALVAPQLLDAPRGAALVASLRERGIEVQDVSASEFSSAAETESPQGILAVADVPRHGFDELAAGWSGVVVILDAVQDPGNVGTILRTAAALGSIATIALPGTVDLWNAKVVRSAMGAHFRHVAFSGTWNALDAFRDAAGVALYAAESGGEPLDAVQAPSRVALVVGNEGAGISPETRARAERLISIPIAPAVESLNVAVATGIILYTLSR